MIPCDSTTQSQLVLLLITDVQRTSLRFTLSLSVATASSTSSTEVAVIHVVGITHKRIAYVAERFHGCQTDTIASVGTNTDVRIGLQTFSGAALGHKFQHEVVVTIVNTRHAAQVTLLVIGFHLVNDIRGQVLHHGVVVARHEVTSVQFEAFHVLTVDGDFSVVINLGTRQRLYQSLNDRPFWHTISIGIIHHRIVLDNHLR